MRSYEIIENLLQEGIINKDERQQLLLSGLLVNDIRLFIERAKANNISLIDFWYVLENPEALQKLVNESEYDGVYYINGKDYWGYKNGKMELDKLTIKEQVKRWLEKE